MQAQRRDLEGSIKRAQKKLQEGKEKWRRLHHQRQTLKHRVATKQPSLLSTPSPAPMQSSCFAEPATRLVPVGDDKGRFHSPARLRHGSDLKMQSQNMARSQMVPGSRHSRYNEDRAGPSLKPISAFKHHTIVSFSALSKYMTSQELRSSSGSNHQQLRHAFLMCQTETAQRLNAQANEICWFLEWPIEACAQQRLCTSISAWSGTCKLTTLVAEMAFSIESTFLVMEHEHLSSAADPFYTPPKRPVLDAIAPLLPPRPNPPDAAVLAAASLRCNIQDFVPLEVAMRRIIQPMVRQYKVLLPQRNWLSVCIQLLRISETVVDVLQSVPNQDPNETCMHANEAISDHGAQCCFEVRVSMHSLQKLLCTAYFLRIKQRFTSFFVSSTLRAVTLSPVSFLSKFRACIGSALLCVKLIPRWKVEHNMTITSEIPAHEYILADIGIRV
jgi:hypothetical protein